MTSLVAWVARDQRGPSSAYIAADSRFTGSPDIVWNYGVKTYVSASFPDVFGFYGDVLAPTTLLSQFIAILDRRRSATLTPAHRQRALREHLRNGMTDIPTAWSRSFAVFHLTRLEHGMNSQFSLQIADWRSDLRAWRYTEPAVPDASAMIAVGGSGAPSVNKHIGDWASSDVSGTSRAIFAAFCASVESGRDPYSGGPIQLVALRRRGAGSVMAVHQAGRTYVCGAPHPGLLKGDIECFNHHFERCDPATGSLLPEAQRQPPPRRLEEVFPLAKLSPDLVVG